MGNETGQPTAATESRSWKVGGGQGSRHLARCTQSGSVVGCPAFVPSTVGTKLSVPLLLVQRICFFLSLPQDVRSQWEPLACPHRLSCRAAVGSGLWPLHGASAALPIPAARWCLRWPLSRRQSNCGSGPCPSPKGTGFALIRGLWRLSRTGSRGCRQEASVPRRVEEVTAAVSLTT